MDFLCIDAKYEKNDFLLDKKSLEYCKKFKTIAIYSAVQFLESVEGIIQQLTSEKINVISSQPERTSAKYQILGCDVYHDNMKLTTEPQAYLYIGDGKFHPKALVLLQKDSKNFKEIICFDPKASKMTILDSSESKSILKKYKASLKLFLIKDTIGIIVTTKPGQLQYSPSKKLASIYPKKKFYYFVENTIDFTRLEDYPFIDVWINSACPRIGFDDNENIPKPMVNLNDALNAVEILSKDSYLTKY